MNILERLILCLTGSPWEPGKLYVGLPYDPHFDARRHRLTGRIEIRVNGVWLNIGRSEATIFITT